jgi:hypothetical protein
MEDENVVAGTGRMLGIDAAQRVMARAGNLFARILIGLAHIDENGALAHKLGGTLR